MVLKTMLKKDIEKEDWLLGKKKKIKEFR